MAGLAVLFVAGALLASVATAQTGTTTLTETTTTAETTTEPGTTVVTTATVRETTTRRVFVTTTPATTAPASSTSKTPAWVWVLLAVLAAIVLILAGVLLARRGGRRTVAVSGVPVDERRRRLDGAVGSWTVQGWGIESQSADSAVLRRGDEVMLVSVDEAGHVSTRPLPGR